MRNTPKFALALLAVCAIVVGGGLAFAQDAPAAKAEKPAAKADAPAKSADGECCSKSGDCEGCDKADGKCCDKAEGKCCDKAKSDTATPSPVHTMMMWVAGEVMDGKPACASTEAGAKKWAAWFDGGADVKHAALRDMFVKHGWTKDKFLGFFAKMAPKNGDCSSCDKTADGDCQGCDKAECKEGKCCGGCKKDAPAEAAPTS